MAARKEQRAAGQMGRRGKKKIREREKQRAAAAFGVLGLGACVVWSVWGTTGVVQMSSVRASCCVVCACMDVWSVVCGVCSVG